jgi:hypothetical protein
MQNISPKNMDLNKKKLTEDIKKLIPEASTVNVNFGKKRIPLPPNIMVFQTFAFLAATELKPATNKVLMLFFASSAYENYVGMDIITIGEKLNITSRSVIAAINELEKNKIIIRTKHPSDKRRNDYFLNPFSSWKGNAESRKKMIEIMPSNQLDLFGISEQDHKIREGNEIRKNTPLLDNQRNIIDLIEEIKLEKQ